MLQMGSALQLTNQVAAARASTGPAQAWKASTRASDTQTQKGRKMEKYSPLSCKGGSNEPRPPESHVALWIFSGDGFYFPVMGFI